MSDVASTEQFWSKVCRFERLLGLLLTLNLTLTVLLVGAYAFILLSAGSVNPATTVVATITVGILAATSGAAAFGLRQCRRRRRPARDE